MKLDFDKLFALLIDAKVADGFLVTVRDIMTNVILYSDRISVENIKALLSCRDATYWRAGDDWERTGLYILSAWIDESNLNICFLTEPRPRRSFLNIRNEKGGLSMSKPRKINDEIIPGTITSSVEDPLITENTLFMCLWTCPACDIKIYSPVYLDMNLQLRRCQKCDECYPVDFSEYLKEVNHE
ncbi:MAG: hypothetical protein WC227_01590 [Patescibacteria group bacterium]|jgi:hypothetical protein